MILKALGNRVALAEVAGPIRTGLVPATLAANADDVITVAEAFLVTPPVTTGATSVLAILVAAGNADIFTSDIDYSVIR